MRKHLIKSLSVRLPLLFAASIIIIMGVVIPLVYQRFHSRMIGQYTRMAEGVTHLMVNAYDADKTEEYMEKNFNLPEYVDTVNYFYTLRDNYPDILYMYVYRFEEDGGHVVIDLDADWWEDGEGYKPGYLWGLDEIEEPFKSQLDKVMAGEQIKGYSEHSKEDGYLFTYTRPIFYSDGSYACTACVDFSMDYLSDIDIDFTQRLSLIMLAIGIVVLILDIVIIRRRITIPIRKLSDCAHNFAYDTEEDRRNNLRLLDEINISTGDEIEDVYNMLQSVTHDSFLATANLTRAFRDIQERDQSLKEALAKAEEANAAKTAFLSTMSHEIRTPMNAIIGLDNIALQDAAIPEHTREELEKIGASARHLLALINDILDMSRIESGRMILKEEEFSFREMVDQINIIINGQCEDKRLTYDSRTIGTTDEYFMGDALRLRQVIINILGNSVKFTDSPGTVTFTVQQTGLEGERRMLHFTMKDTGVGMDEEFIPKIFEPFAQEDATTTNRYGGSGLGMAITKKMVDLMGGRITVQSEKGYGTVFTVDVPLVRAHHVEVVEAAEEAAPSVSVSGRRVLIAEDQEMNAEILSELLDMEEISSEWAQNGQLAVEMFRDSEEGYFDAILMDMRMPVMDGLAATREIRKLDRPDAARIPIVALTANAFEEDIQNCLEAGMNVHLSKPVDIDLLKEALGRMLAEE